MKIVIEATPKDKEDFDRLHSLLSSAVDRLAADFPMLDWAGEVEEH